MTADPARLAAIQARADAASETPWCDAEQDRAYLLEALTAAEQRAADTQAALDRAQAQVAAVNALAYRWGESDPSKFDQYAWWLDLRAALASTEPKETDRG